MNSVSREEKHPGGCFESRNKINISFDLTVFHAVHSDSQMTAFLDNIEIQESKNLHKRNFNHYLTSTFKSLTIISYLSTKESSIDKCYYRMCHIIDYNARINPLLAAASAQ